MAKEKVKLYMGKTAKGKRLVHETELTSGQTARFIRKARSLKKEGAKGVIKVGSGKNQKTIRF